MFAKIKNGMPEILKLPVTISGKPIYTNDPAVLRTIGYKIYNPTQPPAVAPGQTVTVKYEETETEIIQKWIVTGEPETPQGDVLTTDEIDAAIKEGVNSADES